MYRPKHFERLLFETHSLSQCSPFVPVWSSRTKTRHRQKPPCDMAGASLNLVHPLIDSNDISWLGGIHSVLCALSQAWPITVSFPHEVFEHFSWCFMSSVGFDFRHYFFMPIFWLSITGIGQKIHKGWHHKLICQWLYFQLTLNGIARHSVCPLVSSLCSHSQIMKTSLFT